jgi:hypothetical protein
MYQISPVVPKMNNSNSFQALVSRFGCIYNVFGVGISDDMCGWWMVVDGIPMDSPVFSKILMKNVQPNSLSVAVIRPRP